MNAMTLAKPKAVKLNGKAAADFETIEIPLPAGTQTALRLQVGYLPRRGEALPGWRVAKDITFATLRRSENLDYNLAPHATRAAAVLAAVERLVNELVDRKDSITGRQARLLSETIIALSEWGDRFEKQAKKETMTVQTKSSKILNGKECRALLEDFRRSYDTCMHSFLELGEKAAAIRDQEAYGELCETFDQWIKREGYGHSFVYDCIKASKLYRMMAPVLDPRHITLDCESHYRDIPADLSPKEAKAIAGELVLAVAESGSKLTRQHVKAAVAKVRPKKRPARPDVPESIEEEITAAAEPAEPTERPAPRLAAETIEAEYCDVKSEEPDELEQFRVGVQALVAPVLERHGRDGKFLYTAAMILHDASAEVRYYQPPAATQPLRRAK